MLVNSWIRDLHFEASNIYAESRQTLGARNRKAFVRFKGRCMLFYAPKQGAAIHSTRSLFIPLFLA